MSFVWDNGNMSVVLFDEWIICNACELGIVYSAFLAEVKLHPSMDR